MKMSYFCWELYNGRWSPKLYHAEKPEGTRARGVSKSDAPMRTTIYEVDPSMSLADCMLKHPLSWDVSS